MPYRDVAEAATRWVLAQVRYDDEGPWIPEQSTSESLLTPPAEYRDGMHSGIGGLGHLLAEVRGHRPWSADESALADAVVARIRTQAATRTDLTWFDGLVSDLGVLLVLEADGVGEVLTRITHVVDTEGWPEVNDATLGKAGVLVGALDALDAGVESARPLARTALDVVLAQAEQTGAGLNWLFKPREVVDEVVQMPNYSHGLAGVATALARAGESLSRPDATEAARRGAAHFRTLADPAYPGLVVPRRIPPKDGDEVVTWNWCHGPAGALVMFEAIGDQDGVDGCLEALHASGIPERRHPGYWDNDGACCGTAGVGMAVLAHDLAFATSLADACVERAVHEGEHAYWRFLEHRNEDPLLPPGVGWMQGAAGIAAFLWRASRLVSP